MSTLFALVVRQAYITFDRSNAAKFRANFNTLKLLVDQLTSTDLSIDAALLTNKSFERPNKAPVTYLEIFQNKTFTMSVFIVANKYTMPLHDHPGVGLLRVLSGTARVQSYTPIAHRSASSIGGDASILEAIEEPFKEITSRTESAVLTPTKFNLHEITAIKGEPTAFFDILSPPYETDCGFYKKLYRRPQSDANSTSGSDDNSDTATSSKIVILQAIECPLDYNCDSVHYHRPDFLTESKYNYDWIVNLMIDVTTKWHIDWISEWFWMGLTSRMAILWLRALQREDCFPNPFTYSPFSLPFNCPPHFPFNCTASISSF